jgi:type I restriction enzyme S subunit
MSKWISIRLGSLIKINYGKDHKSLLNGDIPVYGSGGFMRYVDKCLSTKESILIPRIGTLDNVIYVKKPFWTVNTMFWTEIDNEQVNPKFIYYQLKLTDFTKLNAGSAVPRLTVPIIESIYVNLPSLVEQKSIAEILTSLDDKMENLNKQNITLESMIQTLFKSINPNPLINPPRKNLDILSE